MRTDIGELLTEADRRLASSASRLGHLAFKNCRHSIFKNDMESAAPCALDLTNDTPPAPLGTQTSTHCLARGA